MNATILSDMKKNVEINNLAIKKLQETNNKLLIDIKRYERIESYEEDKLEDFDNKLKEILNIQKKYNSLVSDRHSPITKKFLPFNYDINEIIRNKIIEDSKAKIEIECLECYFNNKKIHFEETLLGVTSSFCNDIYSHTIHTPIQTYYNHIIYKYNMLFTNLKDTKTIHSVSDLLGNLYGYKKELLEDLIIKYPKIVDKYSKQFEKDYWWIIDRLKGLIVNNNNEINNNQIVSFYNNGEIINIYKNGKANGQGYNKFKKEIFHIFHYSCELLVNEINCRKIGQYWNNYQSWNSYSDTYKSSYYRRLDLSALIRNVADSRGLEV